MAAEPQTSRIRRGIMLIVGLLASVLTFGLGAQVASAHHAEIAASVDCSGKISWTATSWSFDSDTHSGANSAIEVGYVNSSGSKVPMGSGSFADFKQDSPGVPDSFSGTFAWPDNTLTSLTVYTVPLAPWGNGVVSSPVMIFKVTRGAACPSGTPSATVSAACAAGGGTVSGDLTVDLGGVEVTFTIDLPGALVDQVYTVPSGGSQHYSILGVGDGLVSITAPGMTTKTTTVNCPAGAPSATVSVVCGDGSGTVSGDLIVGAGSGSVTFTIDLPGNLADQPATVSSGSSKPYSIPNVGNGTVTITTQGVTLKTVIVDCAPVPSATASVACGATNGTVSGVLSVGAGSGSVTFTIDLPDPKVDPVITVASGKSKGYSYGNLVNGLVSITAKGLTTVTAIVNCAPGVPSAEAKAVCADGAGSTLVGELTVGPGGPPVTFTIDLPGSLADSQTVEVASGESMPLRIDNVANGVVVIRAPGMPAYRVTVSCDAGEPSATASAACAEGGSGIVSGLLTVGPGGGPVTFTVHLPGVTAGRKFTVASGHSLEYSIPDVANGAVSITAPKMTKVPTTVTCPPGTPLAIASVACAEGSGIVSGVLSVGGGSGSVTFTIHLPGVLADQQFVVPSGGTKPYSFANVGQGDVLISAPGMDLVTVAVNCAPGVPSATASVACADGSGTVSGLLAVGPGGAPVTFTIDLPGVLADQQFVVQSGGKESYSIANVGNGTVSITAPGLTTVTTEVLCETAGTGSATISYRCEDSTGWVVITLTHLGGDKPVDFVVGGTTQTLAKGETREVKVTGIADGVYTTPVLVAGVSEVLSVSVERCGLVLSEPPVVVPAASAPPVVPPAVAPPAVVPPAVEPAVLTVPSVSRLPFTGNSGIGNMISAGLVLVGLGVVLVFARRRGASHV